MTNHGLEKFARLRHPTQGTVQPRRGEIRNGPVGGAVEAAEPA